MTFFPSNFTFLRKRKIILKCLIIFLILAVWFIWLSHYSVKKAAYSDECIYLSQAHHFFKSSSFFMNFYIYESLLEQAPPFLPPRHLTYVGLLGSIYKVFGFQEGFYLYLNFFVLTMFLFCFYQFSVRVLSFKKEVWFAILLFASLPIVNFLARLMMADILVIFCFFILIWIMFFYDPPKHFSLAYFVFVVFWFWVCYLTRQTAVFILPVFFFFIIKKKKWKKAIIYLVLFTVTYFFVYWFIERWKMGYPFVPHEIVFKYLRNGQFQKAGVFLIQNFFSNFKDIFSEQLSQPCYIVKASSWMIVGLGIFSYRALSDNGKRLYQVIIPIFVLQYICLMIFFKTYNWTGIRMMAYLYPFFILFIVQAFLRMVSEKRNFKIYQWLFVFFVVFFFFMSFLVAQESYANSTNMDSEHKGVRRILNQYLPLDKKVVVLSNMYGYRRMNIDFPCVCPVYALNTPFLLEEDIEKITQNFKHPDWVFWSLGEKVLIIHNGKNFVLDISNMTSRKQSL